MSETSRNYDLGLTNIQVGELIGGGGFARVYRGYDSLLKRDLAIKILRPVVGQDARTAFENEAGLHGPLSRHENIVTIHHAGFTVGGAHPYLVMDLVTGGSLGQHLEAQGNIAWDQAVSWMTPVCHAVQHVHDSGILHRDIKPDNILLDPPNTPLLSDLGIACLEDETSPIDAMSFPHVAPEALRGQRREAPSDVFSLGTTLYQLIAGTAPFGHALEERVVNLNSVPPPLPPEWRVPLWLEDVLQRALEPDPYLRIQTAEELGAELDSGLAGGLHSSPAVARQASAAAGASPRVAPSLRPAPTTNIRPAVVDTRPQHPSAIPSAREWSVPPMQSLYADPPRRRRPILRALVGIALGVMLLGLAVAIIEGVGSIGADDRTPTTVELTPTTGDPVTAPSDSFGAPGQPTSTVTPTTAPGSPTTTQPPTTGSISQSDDN